MPDRVSLYARWRQWRLRRAQESDMPVFTIKAKDNLALRAVDAYRALCVTEGLAEQAEQVVEAYAEMVTWRLFHPDLCHQPDHKHVPVFEPVGEDRKPTLAEIEEVIPDAKS